MKVQVAFQAEQTRETIHVLAKEKQEVMQLSRKLCDARSIV